MLVTRVGTDPSGRAIYMSSLMEAWWEEFVTKLGFEPTIVQGSWMSLNGGDAKASAGTHDKGGCLDIRVWDRTDEEVYRMIRTARLMAGAAWLRDRRHGMDPHIHLVVGPDTDKSWQAAKQWRDFIENKNGLANGAPDYEWRPSPLVTKWSPNMNKPKRMPKAWHKFYHPLPYHKGNSLRGLRACVAKGLVRADVDILMTWDHVFCAAHWDKPLWHGFRDPEKRIRPDRRISTILYKELRRLVARDGTHIPSMWMMFREAGRLSKANGINLTLELDAKSDARFKDKAHWKRLYSTAQRFEVNTLVKIESTIPGAVEILRAAKAAGFTTAVLPRGNKILKKKDWWPVADYVRGPVVWR